LPEAPSQPGRVVTTGIGGSEGPARVLAHRLREAGRDATFQPLSELVLGASHGSLLVVFSQGLSPNGCLAFQGASVFAERWLVTSVGHGATRPERAERLAQLSERGVRPIVVPPGEERGMLARWVGPTVATLTALRLAGVLGAPSCEDRLDAAPDRYRALSKDRAPLPPAPALVLAGVHADEGHAHRWKILETRLEDPPVWDVLQAAHGPVQSLHGAPRPVVTLERPNAADLVARLARSLPEDGPPLTRLVASSDDALAVIDHAALIDAALLAALRAEPRDLLDWPGRGREASLYGLGSD
jgi:hypothetical protein